MNSEKEKSKIDSYNNLKALQEDYIILIKGCLFEFNKETNPPLYKTVYQNLLQRLYYSIKASTVLMQLFNKDKNYKLPVALQLRTGLLDCITLIYLSQFVDSKDESKFQNAFDVLNFPTCREWSKEITSKNLKKKDLESQFNLAKSHFPNHFIEENGKIILNNCFKELKPNEMIKSIKDGPLV